MGLRDPRVGRRSTRPPSWTKRPTLTQGRQSSPDRRPWLQDPGGGDMRGRRGGIAHRGRAWSLLGSIEQLAAHHRPERTTNGSDHRFTRINHRRRRSIIAVGDSPSVVPLAATLSQPAVPAAASSAFAASRPASSSTKPGRASLNISGSIRSTRCRDQTDREAGEPNHDHQPSRKRAKLENVKGCMGSLASAASASSGPSGPCCG